MAESPPPSPKKPPRRIPAATVAPAPADKSPPAQDWRLLYGATGDSPKKNVWRSEPAPRPAAKPPRPPRPPHEREAAPPGRPPTGDRGPRAQADRPKAASPGGRPDRREGHRDAPGTQRAHGPRHRPRHEPAAQVRHDAGTPSRAPRDEPRAQAHAPGPSPAEFVGPPRPDQRLSKVLADRGVASRREADEWIEAGWVKVDGVVAVLGARVLPHQAIEIDAAARTRQARRVTILLHKPIGYVSGQAEDGYQPAGVLVTEANHWPDDPARERWHPGHARGLAPAGRLDIDSTGLLVLTQDGRVARHLIGEDSDVEKEYLVRVEYPAGGRLPEADLERLRHGLELDGRKLRPAKVSWANEDQLRFVLREGRKRQIRRMCEAVGLVVTGLKRVRIGSVALGPLPPGQWRYLREGERF